MPYMAVSTGAAIRNQLQFVGAAITDDYQAHADVIFCISTAATKNTYRKNSRFKLSVIS